MLDTTLHARKKNGAQQPAYFWIQSESDFPRKLIVDSPTVRESKSHDADDIKIFFLGWVELIQRVSFLEITLKLKISKKVLSEIFNLDLFISCFVCRDSHLLEITAWVTLFNLICRKQTKSSIFRGLSSDRARQKRKFCLYLSNLLRFHLSIFSLCITDSWSFFYHFGFGFVSLCLFIFVLKNINIFSRLVAFFPGGKLYIGGRFEEKKRKNFTSILIWIHWSNWGASSEDASFFLPLFRFTLQNLWFDNRSARARTLHPLRRLPAGDCCCCWPLCGVASWSRSGGRTLYVEGN